MDYIHNRILEKVSKLKLDERIESELEYHATLIRRELERQILSEAKALLNIYESERRLNHSRCAGDNCYSDLKPCWNYLVEKQKDYVKFLEETLENPIFN